MKKMILKGIFAFSLLTFTQLLSFSPLSASASAQSDGKPSLVQYAGKAEGFLLFDVIIPASSKDRTTLSISNENGEELYSEVVHGSQSARRIRIEAADMKQVQFRISSRRTSFSKTFSVNTSYVEKTEVVEVK